MITSHFATLFGSAPQICCFTPGRVNLMGEHTDYNGGMVLPTSLDNGISLALSLRNDSAIHIQSDKFPNTAQRSIADNASDHWSDYITGALILANNEGLVEGGADIAVETTLAFGAGISSSAAVTVGIFRCIRGITGAALSDTDIAILARRVENDFIGTPCGIMDQMAVALAHKGQALALQTDTLDYNLIALPVDFTMAVIHSGVFRRLNEGRYKERKEECDVIKAALQHEKICQITDDEFATLAHLPELLQRRARHCMTEHRRTVEAAGCLHHNDIERMGVLMNESHLSMRDDFEITVPATDQLVDDAVRFGALGARQTGGGFGGCIVACVPKEDVKKWQAQLLAHHPAAFWICGTGAHSQNPAP